MPTATRTAQPDNDAALAAAYAHLSDDDSVTGPITVRALREAAGVSTAAASAWLKAHRAAQNAPGPVPDDLADLVPLHDLWARAVTLARDEVRSKHASELLDAHDARIKAEESLDSQRRIFKEVKADRDRLAEKLASSEQTLDDARIAQRQFLSDIDRANAKADDAEQRANTAETTAAERVHAAELARAEAEAAGLREALAMIRPDAETT